jgi:hypothetical protein
MSTFFKETIADFLRQTPCSKGTRLFLLRLLDDPDKRIDGIWQGHIDGRIAEDDVVCRLTFIKVLAAMWGGSERAIMRAARIDAERAVKKVLAADNKLVAKAIRDKKTAPETKIAALNWAMEWLQALAEYQTKCQNLNNLADPETLHHVALVDIRSDHKGSRQRTAFMRLAADFFYKATGEWHDNWIATLTDIAFPDEEATSIDMVRSARRGIRP